MSIGVQCNLDYLDPFGHDAYMGILDKWYSPDNWSNYFSPPVSRCVTIKQLLYITTITNTIHASMLGYQSSIEIAFSEWSPHFQMPTDPALCTCILIHCLSLGETNQWNFAPAKFPTIRYNYYLQLYKLWYNYVSVLLSLSLFKFDFFMEPVWIACPPNHTHLTAI